MPAVEPRPHWYALHVRPNHEMAVAMRLKELDIQKYVPTYRDNHRAANPATWRPKPLFPGYVFTFMDLNVGPRLYNVAGILRILGRGGHPIPIDEQEIDVLRTVVSSNLPVKGIPFLQTGDRIEVIGGPLAGITGNFIRIGKTDQLVVSLPLLHRSLAVSITASWVCAIEANR